MIPQSDSIDFAAARMAMIDSELRPQGIADPAVLAAIASVPRERFVTPGAEALAYGDRGAPAANGGALIPPAAFGLLLQALVPQAGERALVVGIDPAYAAAVLTALGVSVATDAAAPGHYDIILIDGAVEAIPDALTDRLTPGGRLAGAIDDDGVTRLIVGARTAGAFGYTSIGDAFVPRLPGFERPRAFVF